LALITFSSSLRAATPLITMSDATSNSNFGRSVADDIDFNGDGFSDLVVGDPSFNRVSVYFGGPGHDNVADLVMSGIPGLGICVRRLPDITGDGIDELAVGAPGGGSGEQVVIYYGGASPDNVADVTVPAPPPTFNVTETFGFSIACGDVNGDGISDLVVGAYGYMPFPLFGAPRGRTYVYFGSPGFGTTPNLTLTGEADGDYFGTCVAVGDVTGDGKGDILVSAPFHGHGRVYVYNGGAGLDAVADRICEPPIGGYMGNGDNVRAADLNGDGIADIVAGAPGFPSRVNVFWGGATTTTPDLSIPGVPNDTFGTSIAVGDFCGDAALDLVVGAPEIGQPTPGKTYVFMGGACLDGDPEDVIAGNAGDQYAGVEVANVGSFVAGKDQFVIVANHTPNGTGASATVYVPDVETADGPIVITAQPTGVIAQQGGSEGFSVFVTGNNLTYTWRRNGVPIAGAPNARFIALTNIQPGDAGSYDVRICNGCGCVTSQAVTLQVCAPASASIPALVHAGPGDASATIQATATPAVVVSYWMFNKLVVTNGAKYSGAGTTTLTITNPVAADAGLYQLFYTGPCGGAMATNVCKFDVSPCSPSASVVVQPVDQTVLLGSPAAFSIQSGGCDIPTYQWQRWSDVARTWVNIAGATGSSLSFAAVASGDLGQYRCVVSAPNGSSAISNPANLNQSTPRLLMVGSKPLGCGLALVSWTTNVPMTGVVQFGADCATLNQASQASSLGYSGAAVLDLSAATYAAFRVVATAPGGEVATSGCQSAQFSSPLGNLSAMATIQPYYGNLYATGDGIPVRIHIANTGCGPIAGPITLTDLKLNGSFPPRKSDHSADLPHDLTVTGLSVNEARDIILMFSKTELNLPPKSGVVLSGVIQYGTPVRQVTVSDKTSLP
jgi:hypothetical protein